MRQPWTCVLTILFATAFFSGCSILAPFYLGALMMGYDNRVEPAFQFPDDAKRIAVITYLNLDTQVEIGHFDQELNEAISRRLFAYFDEKKKDVSVIKASKVAKWQDEHPDWTTWDVAEIGKALKADYVIYLELDNVSLYEDGPSRSLYRGQAEVGLSVVRVENNEPAFAKDVISIEVPKGRPIPADQMPPAKFRREFIQRMADRVSWYFTPHDRTLEHDRDPI